MTRFWAVVFGQSDAVFIVRVAMVELAYIRQAG